MALNKPVFYRSVAEIERRATEMGLNSDQFVTGCNRGVANGSIGVNTGDYDPKVSDYARITHFAGPVSYIGQLAQAEADIEINLSGITDEQLPSLNVAVRVGFDVAAANTAPDADYGTLPLTNYTGAEIPAGGWAWGFEAVGGDPVAPIADAGGPYQTTFSEPNYAPVQLDGTITPGTDPAPAFGWGVFSGGTGTFNAPVVDAIFTPTSFDGGGVITLVFVVDPDDGPSVPDFATVTLI